MGRFHAAARLLVIFVALASFPSAPAAEAGKKKKGEDVVSTFPVLAKGFWYDIASRDGMLYLASSAPARVVLRKGKGGDLGEPRDLLVRDAREDPRPVLTGRRDPRSGDAAEGDRVEDSCQGVPAVIFDQPDRLWTFLPVACGGIRRGGVGGRHVTSYGEWKATAICGTFL